MSFFVVGGAYSPKERKQGFSTKPILTTYKEYEVLFGETFIVLELKPRWMTREDEALVMSPAEVNNALVYQLKVMADNRILYLCYLYGSEIELSPEKYFVRVS